MITDGMSGAESKAEISGMLARLARGDVRAMARAISVVEAGATGAAELLVGCEERVHGRTERAWRIGVTGPPGAGKSTLIDALVQEIRRGGRTVGVIGVDPTSPLTGGALLGDRIRLHGAAGDGFGADNGVFVRSMASRGASGGLAERTADVATVIEAAGFEVLVIETVGVGQGEVAIARLAEVTVLVLVPGMGDEVQSLKAGVMEIADVFAVNKCDQPGAERLEAEILAMQGLVCAQEGWRAPVVRTGSSTGEGVPALMTAIRRCLEWKRA